MNVYVTMKSSNRKVGPIPVTTSAMESCPEACPLKNAGCYADGGPLAILWKKVSSGAAGHKWDAFIEIVRGFKPGQMWRHNQAGDLPGKDNVLDGEKVYQLLEANSGKRGFTYTHYPMKNRLNRAIVKRANKEGFTINVSLNSLTELEAAFNDPIYDGLPLTAVAPPEYENEKFVEGMSKTAVVCPAVNGTAENCVSCGLCQKANRKVAIVFPAHGIRKNKMEAA